LKNKEAKTEAENVSAAGGESCCNGAGCCKHKS
jgi:hypothetical protein